LSFFEDFLLWAVISAGNIADAAKPWYFFITNDQCTCALLCREIQDAH
jgi:hypothetical protein